ncbi:MAG: GNAT family N-acetyltransferase [Lachnospiraceae bacterium]|nr:GNAT family N-acetyltransferase [Lachnospiraceae bacterium]
MIFRNTQEKDRAQVIALWRQAQAYFKAQGIDQWQDGYPDAACLEADMANGESYVLVEEDTEEVLATCFISFAGEPDYDVIYDGNWQEPEPYGVVHRVAVTSERKGQGLAGQLISYAAAMCRERGIGSIRMDTHEDNRSMQRMLSKNGFLYRGIIYLGRDGAKRVAFEKSLT